MPTAAKKPTKTPVPRKVPLGGAHPKRAKAKAHEGVKAGSNQRGAEARRVLFVEAYLGNGRNGTQAAISAGFAVKSAHVQASDLLKHPKVVELLAQREADLANRYKLHPEGVYRAAAQRLYFDPRKLYHADGRPKAIHELDDDTAMALSSMTTEVVVVNGRKVNQLKSVAWYDKNQAGNHAADLLHMKKEERRDDNPLAGASMELIRALVKLLEGGDGN